MSVRIGVFPGRRAYGGVYQYSLTMVEALTGAPALAGDELVLVHERDCELPLAELRLRGWETAELPRSVWPRPRLAAARRAAARSLLGPVVRTARRRLFPPPVRDPERPAHDAVLHAWLTGLGVDLMLYPTPTRAAFEAPLPYLAAVHDLQHRLQPEFPEVSADGELAWREYLFRNLIRSATVVLADSDVGREDVLDLYGEFGATEDQVKVLPYTLPGYVFESFGAALGAEVRARHHLPERYLFYPAQFWPHKNHARLVHALALLRDRGLETPLVLCGTHAGPVRDRTYRDLRRLIKQLRLGSLVHQRGYVPDEDMAGLYAESVALVMPTLFGPTNIPVLEAWASGCPVLTSDLRGIREHAGDAALLADPRSVEEIAAGIERIWTDDEARHMLVERGRARLRAFTPDVYRSRLLAILEDARSRIG